jgi:hypothetical protein
MKFYAYIPTVRGKEPTGSANKLLFELRTIEGAIRRAKRILNTDNFQLYSYSNFYDNKTFKHHYSKPVNQDRIEYLAQFIANPDGLLEETLEELAVGINNHPVKFARAAFPDRPRGWIEATKDIANYCWNKLTAMRCRKEGHINRAMMYEEICDKIYKELPEYAKW